MRIRTNPWLLVAFALACGAGILGFLKWRHDRAETNLLAYTNRLPMRDGISIHIDLDGIRRTGLMDSDISTAALEDAEYRRFVTESGFDWKTDLDEVIATKLGNDWFIFARGRFDWAKLRSYVAARHGQCHNGVCNAEGVTQGRWISFYPVNPRIVAFASSDREGAVYALQRESLAKLDASLPEGPLWVTFPGRTLAGDPSLPAGGRLFGKVLAETKRVTFFTRMAGPSAELAMTAVCADAVTADTLRRQLDAVTQEFRKYFERLGQKPGTADLSGVLLAGRFEVAGDKLIGHWPLQRQFIQTLLAGGE